MQMQSVAPERERETSDEAEAGEPRWFPTEGLGSGRRSGKWCISLLTAIFFFFLQLARFHHSQPGNLGAMWDSVQRFAQYPCLLSHWLRFCNHSFQNKSSISKKNFNKVQLWLTIVTLLHVQPELDSMFYFVQLVGLAAVSFVQVIGII